jgi:hypothetical protein
VTRPGRSSIAALFACAFALVAALLWGRAPASTLSANEGSSWSSFGRGDLPTCDADTDRGGPARALTGDLDDDDDQDDELHDDTGTALAQSSRTPRPHLAKARATAKTYARGTRSRRRRCARSGPSAPRGPPRTRSI